MKKIFIIGLGILVLLTGCAKKTKKLESTVNTNENVVSDKVVDNFKFENTSLIYEDESSVFETTITNVGTLDEDLEEIEIVVKDKKGNEIVTLSGFIGSTILVNESKVITSYCNEDLRNAYSIEYKIIK